MKKLHQSTERAHEPKEHARANGFSRYLAGAAAGLALSLSPMLSGTALAQDRQPPAAARQEAPAGPRADAAAPQLRGDVFPISEGGRDLQSRLVYEARSMAPSMSVEGPGTAVLRFYPILNLSSLDAESRRQNYSIRYTVDGQARQQAASSGVSGFTSPIVPAESSAVGTPVEVRVELPAGAHEVAFQYPNGFLELVSFARPAPRQPAVPAQPAPAPVEAPAEAPEEAPARPLLYVDGEWAPLHSVGSAGNSGDLIAAQAHALIPLTDNLELAVGALFSTYGLSLASALSQTDARSYSADIAAGLSYRNGEHQVYALGYGGYLGVTTLVQSLADGREQDEIAHNFGYGGVLGYRYGEFAALRVQGGNDPFNPLSVRLFGAIPFTWISEPRVYPWLEADFLWLHALAPQGTDIGEARLGENAYHLRALAGIPIWRLGPIVPSAVAGGEFSFGQGGLQNGTGIFGGALRADFSGFEIEGIGAATLHGDPLVLLRLGYSR